MRWAEEDEPGRKYVRCDGTSEDWLAFRTRRIGSKYVRFDGMAREDLVVWSRLEPARFDGVALQRPQEAFQGVRRGMIEENSDNTGRGRPGRF